MASDSLFTGAGWSTIPPDDLPAGKGFVQQSTGMFIDPGLPAAGAAIALPALHAYVDGVVAALSACHELRN